MEYLLSCKVVGYSELRLHAGHSQRSITSWDLPLDSSLCLTKWYSQQYSLPCDPSPQPLHARLREPRAPLPPLRALSPTPAASPPPTLDPEVEDARERLRRAALSCSRWGWLSFWVQLVLCTVAAVITLFSMAFTSQVGRFWAIIMRDSVRLSVQF